MPGVEDGFGPLQVLPGFFFFSRQVPVDGQFPKSFGSLYRAAHTFEFLQRPLEVLFSLVRPVRSQLPVGGSKLERNACFPVASGLSAAGLPAQLDGRLEVAPFPAQAYSKSPQLRRVFQAGAVCGIPSGFSEGVFSRLQHLPLQKDLGKAGESCSREILPLAGGQLPEAFLEKVLRHLMPAHRQLYPREIAQYVAGQRLFLVFPVQRGTFFQCLPRIIGASAQQQELAEVAESDSYPFAVSDLLEGMERAFGRFEGGLEFSALALNAGQVVETDSESLPVSCQLPDPGRFLQVFESG